MGAEPQKVQTVAVANSAAPKTAVLPSRVATIGPDLPLVNEMHPQLSSTDRFAFALFHVNPAETAEYLKKKGFHYTVENGGHSYNDYAIWKDGDRKKYKLDPKGFVLSDIPAEVAYGVGLTAKMAPAMLADGTKIAGLLGTPVTGGGSYAAAMISGAAIVGGTELGAQLLGMALGYRDELNVPHIVISAAAGAVLASAFRYFASTPLGRAAIDKFAKAITYMAEKARPLIDPIIQFAKRGGDWLSEEGKKLLETTMKKINEKVAPEFERAFNNFMDAFTGKGGGPKLLPEPVGGTGGPRRFDVQMPDPKGAKPNWRPGYEYPDAPRPMGRPAEAPEVPTHMESRAQNTGSSGRPDRGSGGRGGRGAGKEEFHNDDPIGLLKEEIKNPAGVYTPEQIASKKAELAALEQNTRVSELTNGIRQLQQELADTTRALSAIERQAREQQIEAARKSLAGEVKNATNAGKPAPRKPMKDDPTEKQVDPLEEVERRIKAREKVEVDGRGSAENTAELERLRDLRKLYQGDPEFVEAVQQLQYYKEQFRAADPLQRGPFLERVEATAEFLLKRAAKLRGEKQAIPKDPVGLLEDSLADAQSLLTIGESGESLKLATAKVSEMKAALRKLADSPAVKKLLSYRNLLSKQVQSSEGEAAKQGLKKISDVDESIMEKVVDALIPTKEKLIKFGVSSLISGVIGFIIYDIAKTILDEGTVAIIRDSSSKQRTKAEAPFNAKVGELESAVDEAWQKGRIGINKEIAVGNEEAKPISNDFVRQSEVTESEADKANRVRQSQADATRRMIQGKGGGRSGQNDPNYDGAQVPNPFPTKK